MKSIIYNLLTNYSFWKLSIYEIRNKFPNKYLNKIINYPLFVIGNIIDVYHPYKNILIDCT